MTPEVIIIHKVQRFSSGLPALAAFFLLLIFPAGAAEGARQGLELCSRVIIPALFPLAVVSGLLIRLGVLSRAGGFLAPLTKKLFGTETGGGAFLLGLTGGYPLGSLTVSELYASGRIDRREALHLISFCDNSGPAFIVSAVGVGVFGSVKTGFFLYAVHGLAAILTGIILSKKPTSNPGNLLIPPQPDLPFSSAFTQSVSAAALSAANICGFVVFFNVLTSLVESAGVLPALQEMLWVYLGLKPAFTKALAAGLLELGSALNAMSELTASAADLALTSFILGWGGLSVHAQSSGALNSAGLTATPRFFGKLLHGAISALLALLLAPVIL